uniref:Oxidoreductase NAD-binding domain-containing protein 1 isoform X4 n=1 Tax=Geotrypetes seraphini TaxID=260995 RepID=A0A6P8PWJ5_GEOSA|nr:oxidoreductase NAD-binding domain-containing protein 1 isoform X4 [Geotrypetes seraphini]
MAHAVVSAVPYIYRSLRRSARIFFGQTLVLLWRPTVLRRCIFNRTMSSSRKIDHLERTASNFRQEIISPAKVCQINTVSETVKSVGLAIANSDFTFKAGQWVDFFIPGVPKVGGFSICSSPGLLERERILELAVKYAEHPPAHWIHTQKNILNLINKFPGKISCSFHVTQQKAQVCEELQPYTTEGRISEKDLAKYVCKDNLYYICGPPPMIQSLCKQLQNLHVPREQIHFEQWW